MNKTVHIDLSVEQRQLRHELTAMAERINANVIDPSLYLCPENNCIVTTESGKPIYKDGVHLRSFYVERIADFMDQTL